LVFLAAGGTADADRPRPLLGLSFLLFPAESEPVLFAPEFEPLDSLTENIEVVTFPWGSLNCDRPFAVLEENLESELKALHISCADVGTLGVSPGRSPLPVQSAEQPPLPDEILPELVRGFRTGRDLDTAFLRLYLHKTEKEIGQIRWANKIAHVGLEAWRASLVPGATEAETAAVAEAAIHRCTGIDGIGTARGWAMVQSGPNTSKAGRFNRSSGRRIVSCDLVLIELATCVDGYWSDLTRTVTIGEGPEEARDLLSVVHEAQRTGLRAVLPGVLASEVDAAGRTVLSEAGYGAFFTHATGHHFGFRYHDPGFPIAPDVREPLECGMVITVEPGAYILERQLGARTEDNIVVTELGAEILS
jgi:Xaa-Pro dipeptidase